MPRLMNDDEWRRVRMTRGPRALNGAPVAQPCDNLSADFYASSEIKLSGNGAREKSRSKSCHYVEVPTGVSPGDVISVVIMGSSIPVTLPQGATPGNYLEVMVERKGIILKPDIKKFGFTDTEHEKASRVSDIVLKGNEFLLDGQLDEAVELYSAGLSINPMHAVLYNNRSVCYLKKQMPEEALADAEKCIEIHPTFHKGWLRKGKALYELNDLPSSLEAIQRGIWLEPESQELLEAMDCIVNAMQQQTRNRSSRSQKCLGSNEALPQIAKCTTSSPGKDSKVQWANELLFGRCSRKDDSNIEGCEVLPDRCLGERTQSLRLDHLGTLFTADDDDEGEQLFPSHTEPFEQSSFAHNILFKEHAMNDVMRIDIPWATCLIGSPVPADWKEGIDFSAFANVFSNLEQPALAPDELVVLRKQRPNRTPPAIWDRSCRRVNVFDIGKISPGLMQQLYSGERPTSPRQVLSHEIWVDPFASEHKLSAIALRDLGNEAYLEMRFESALHYFSVGLALNANDSVLLNNRSKTLFDLGDFNRSLLDAESIIALRPEWFRGWLRAALSLSKQGKHREARECIIFAIQSEPENQELLHAFDMIVEQSAYLTTQVQSSVPNNALVGAANMHDSKIVLRLDHCDHSSSNSAKERTSHASCPNDESIRSSGGASGFYDSQDITDAFISLDASMADLSDQQGYPGLELVEVSPYFVMGVPDLRDAHYVQQGQGGYGNDDVVIPSDKLVKVDGWKVEELTWLELDGRMRGQINSLAVLTFVRFHTGEEYTVNVVRHIHATSAGGMNAAVSVIHGASHSKNSLTAATRGLDPFAYDPEGHRRADAVPRRTRRSTWLKELFQVEEGDEPAAGDTDWLEGEVFGGDGSTSSGLRRFPSNPNFFDFAVSQVSTTGSSRSEATTQHFGETEDDADVSSIHDSSLLSPDDAGASDLASRVAVMARHQDYGSPLDRTHLSSQGIHDQAQVPAHAAPAGSTSPITFGDFRTTSSLLDHAAEQALMKFEHIFDVPDDPLGNLRAYLRPDNIHDTCTLYSSGTGASEAMLGTGDFSEEC